jgi:hypothetical protein
MVCLRKLPAASKRKMADDSRYYDDRNRASHLEAQGIMEYLSVNGRAIPCI